MSKIKKEDIDLFRRYFLSHNDVVKNGMRQIIPIALLKSLSILEDGLMRSGNMENVVINLGSEQLMPELKQLQIDYYISLASRNIEGEKNQEIEVLLNNDNKLFKDILNNFKDPLFENDIKNAFKLLERASLKKKFQELELASEISNEELAQAFKLKERAKLKAQFQEIEKKSNLKVPASVVSFNWKSFAIAASVIGVLIASSIVLLNNNKSPIDIVSENIDKSKVVLDSQKINKLQQINELLANNYLPFEERKIKILSNETFGFSKKEKRITLIQYELKNTLEKLELQILKSTETSINKLIQNRIDSLRDLNYKYNFSNNILKIHLISSKEILVIDFKKEQFLKIGDKIYIIKSSAKNQSLKILENSEVIDKIESIIRNN